MTASHSALYPIGPQSGHIYNLWWFLFWLAAIVWVVVMVFMVAALFRRRREGRQTDERRMTQVVVVAGAFTVLALFAVLVSSAATGSVLSARPNENVLNVEVIGHQWWWEVNYEDAHQPQNIITTANEVHLPVGRPVVLKTTSHDVIHSVFMPNLYGKIDSIPAHINTTWFRADQPGTFRGECAEFCGLQHAHMHFMIVADAPEQFAAWQQQQRAPARAAVSDDEKGGQQVFLNGPCILCHTIRGTDAAGQLAPDLTHVGSRQTIAAATLPNTPENVSSWVHNSQQFKPGNKMPPMALSQEDLRKLAVYLESLK